MGEFLGISKHTTSRGARNPVHRERAFFLPTFDGSLVAIKESGYFFPRI
jgi:hypothetical protein